MALVNNVRNANTLYIDTAAADHQATTDDNLVIKNIKVSHIILTATAATAVLSLKDVSTDAEKMRLEIDTANKSQLFDFSDRPILFPNGIHPETVTDCVATLVLQETQS